MRQNSGGILDLQVGVEVNRLVVCSAQYERIGWGESQRPLQWTWSG